MKKSYLITILVSVFIVLGGLLFYNYTKNSVQDDKETTENKDNIPTEENNNNNISGNYIITYTDKTPKDIKANVASTLIINSDATFLFKYNNCDIMPEISGKYEIKDDILTLLDTANINQGKNITFTIVSNNEIYLNDSIGCVINAQEYQKGNGSFKKTNN